MSMNITNSAIKKVETLMKEKRYNKSTLSKALEMADMTLIRKLNGKNAWKFDDVYH